jgi:hypothetical protein
MPMPPKLRATPVTLETLRALGEIQATLPEAAAVLRVSKAALQRFFDRQKKARKVFEEGKEQGKMSLRRKLWNHADKHFACAIFLAKNHLGMRDSLDTNSTITHEISIELQQILKVTDGQQRSLPDFRVQEIAAEIQAAAKEQHANGHANGNGAVQDAEVIPPDHPMAKFN